MKLRKLLDERKDAIIKRWLEDVLATYPKDASAAFRRQKDPFTNPIGNALREGTRGIFDALHASMDGDGTSRNVADLDSVREHLHRIIKIRAIQEFSASQAVGFVFQLKEAVRAELVTTIEGFGQKDPRLASALARELAKFDGRIDQIALAAFDLYVESREQVYQLRVNEAKRRVSWVVDKLNKRGIDPDVRRVNNG